MKYLSLSEVGTLDDIKTICADLPADEVQQFEAMTGYQFDADKVAAALAESAMPPVWLIRDENDDPLVFCGAWQQSPGFFVTYFLARPKAWAEHGEEVTNITQGLIEAIFHDFGARRIEVRCLADRMKARRWYEKHLGLEYEGTLKCLGVNGEGVAVYSATRAG